MHTKTETEFADAITPAAGTTESCRACGNVLHPCDPELFDTRFGIPTPFRCARCRACGLEQTCPRLTDPALKELYERHYNYGGEKKTKRYSQWRERFLFSPVYSLWTRLDGDFSFHGICGHGRLLDAGCNEGRGLLLYRRNGFDAEGLELNPVAAEVARARGFVVHTATLDELPGEQEYDVIILANVLEHTQEPTVTLRDVYRLLRPGGQVWISCPNAKSWMRKCFGSRWINWHIPFHTVHFSAETLSDQLRQSGFAEIQVQQKTPALWVASSILVALFARRGRATTQLRSVLWVGGLILGLRIFAFPILYLANRCGGGDCLMVRATR